MVLSVAGSIIRIETFLAEGKAVNYIIDFSRDIGENTKKKSNM